MNPFTEQFKNASDIRLTSAERSRIQTALRSAMEPESIPSPFFISSFFVTRFAFALALVLIVTGGTAYAAHGALPGDLLYPVKVGVNEPVSGALAFTDTAKAAWHADIAETRLAEAETLAEKGTLTASTSEELAVNFSEHADAVAALTGDISLSDPASGRDISAKFSSLIARHGAAILAAGKRSNNAIALRASGDLVVKAAGSPTEVRESDKGIQDAGATAQTISAAAPAPSMRKVSVSALSAPAESSSEDASTSAQDLSIRAHAALAEATSTLASLNLSDSGSIDADSVASIEKLIVKGDAELSIGSYDDAAHDFTKALTLTQKFEASIETGGQGRINRSHLENENGIGPAVQNAFPE